MEGGYGKEVAGTLGCFCMRVCVCLRLCVRVPLCVFFCVNDAVCEISELNVPFNTFAFVNCTAASSDSFVGLHICTCACALLMVCLSVGWLSVGLVAVVQFLTNLVGTV